MKKHSMDKYRKILLDEKDRFLKSNDVLEHGVQGEGGGLDQSFLDSVGELSSYDNHPADHGDIMYERSKDIALRDNNKSFLGMIDDALNKIDQGVYGICDHCGKPIASERLEAFPYTTMCRECKDFVERYDDSTERPLEEVILDVPFARTFTDGEDNVVFDGEDAWQKVARYGTSNGPAYEPGAVDPDDAFEDADEPQGEVSWGDGVIDAGFTGEFAEDVHTGNRRRIGRTENIGQDQIE